MTTDGVTTQTIQLEQLRFAARLFIERQLAEQLRGGIHSVEWLVDYETHKYILDIRSKFFGKKQDHVLPPVPVSWWDHFKRDAIPTFTRLLRLTINERREVLRAATIFPDVPQLPGDRFYYRETIPLSRWQND